MRLAPTHTTPRKFDSESSGDARLYRPRASSSRWRYFGLSGASRTLFSNADAARMTSPRAMWIDPSVSHGFRTSGQLSGRVRQRQRALDGPLGRVPGGQIPRHVVRRRCSRIGLVGKCLFE